MRFRSRRDTSRSSRGDRPSRVHRAERAAARTCRPTAADDARRLVLHPRLGPADQEAPLALLCGVVAFDSSAVHDVLAVLPPIIRVDSAAHPMMAALLPLLAGELREPRPGGDAVSTRLADVLVVETVRAWLAEQDDAATGWLAALRDPQLGPAIAAVHRAPGDPWTLGLLAARATMSRSGFAARFTDLVGTSPMSYVASTRMRAARTMLADGRTVAAVAGRSDTARRRPSAAPSHASPGDAGRLRRTA